MNVPRALSIGQNDGNTQLASECPKSLEPSHSVLITISIEMASTVDRTVPDFSDASGFPWLNAGIFTCTHPEGVIGEVTGGKETVKLGDCHNQETGDAARLGQQAASLTWSDEPAVATGVATIRVYGGHWEMLSRRSSLSSTPQTGNPHALEPPATADPLGLLATAERHCYVQQAYGTAERHR
jgi:hypothetical protein